MDTTKRDNIIEQAIENMEDWAEDNSHGYDQSNRWGPDYDCSSAVIQAWQNAGVPVKTKGATYTGNMYSVFKACGFEDVTSQVGLISGIGLKRGDVLLNHVHHTAMYCGYGKIVQASINEYNTTTGGQTGDQTGREFYIRDYYNYPWDCVLRYVGDGATNEDDSSKYVPSYWYNIALPLLKPGMTDDTVITVQRLLYAYGYQASVSGMMDEATVAAVKAYQTAHNLDADGEVGGMTWADLLLARRG